MTMPELTTLPRVKEYLRNTNLGENGESVLKDFIATASRLIRQHTRRRFTSPRITQTREFRSYGMGLIHIDEVFSASDITAVKDELGVDVLYTLDPGFDPEPYGLDLKPESLSMRFGIQGLPDQHNDNFIRELRGDWTNKLPERVFVTATYGYADGSIPPEIEFAARRACRIWWKEEVAHYTDDAFISRGNIFEPEELPPIVRGMLRKARINVEVAV